MGVIKKKNMYNKPDIDVKIDFFSKQHLIRIFPYKQRFPFFKQKKGGFFIKPLNNLRD